MCMCVCVRERERERKCVPMNEKKRYRRLGLLSACAYSKSCKKYALNSPLRLKIREN